MIRGGVGPTTTTRPSAGELAARWDYVLRRGYLSPRQIAEAIEFGQAAIKRAKP